MPELYIPRTYTSTYIFQSVWSGKKFCISSRKPSGIPVSGHAHGGPPSDLFRGSSYTIHSRFSRTIPSGLATGRYAHLRPPRFCQPVTQLRGTQAQHDILSILDASLPFVSLHFPLPPVLFSRNSAQNLPRSWASSLQAGGAIVRPGTAALQLVPRSFCDRGRLVLRGQ